MHGKIHLMPNTYSVWRSTKKVTLHGIIPPFPSFSDINPRWMIFSLITVLRPRIQCCAFGFIQNKCLPVCNYNPSDHVLPRLHSQQSDEIIKERLYSGQFSSSFLQSNPERWRFSLGSFWCEWYDFRDYCLEVDAHKFALPQTSECQQEFQREPKDLSYTRENLFWGSNGTSLQKTKKTMAVLGSLGPVSSPFGPLFKGGNGKSPL